MTLPRKKVPYTKASKRNPLKDIPTDAARRAKHRAAEKDAESKLRKALGNPTDAKGNPLAGHLVATIAANQLVSGIGQNVQDHFGLIANMFLSKLTYLPNGSVSVQHLWSTFLNLLETADATFAREIAQNYQTAFWWYVNGYVHRISAEYDNLPTAILAVEIWKIKGRYKSIALQRNGGRREIHRQDGPESPMLLRAGSEFRQIFAASDVEQIKEIGAKRFVQELISGKRTFAPRPSVLLHEDTLVNVTMPLKSALSEIRRDITSWFSLLNKRRARPSA